MLSKNLIMLSLALFSIIHASSLHAADLNNRTTTQDLDDEPNPIGHLLHIAKPESQDDSEKLHWLINFIVKNDGNAINAQRKKMHGNTPLHTAANGQHAHAVETVKLLLELHADVTITNNNGNTPLEEACRRDFQITDNNFNTALFLAQHECADRAIIEKNKRKEGSNPFHHLMENSALPTDTQLYMLMDHLRKAGYSVNARDKLSQTPAHYAMIHQKKEALTRLLTVHGADFSITNRIGQTPTEFAEGHKKFLEQERQGIPLPRIPLLAQGIVGQCITTEFAPTLNRFQ